MRLLVEAFRNNIWIFFFFGLIALIPLVPMASNTFVPNERDIYNHIAMIIQAKQALLEGQFPLRIAPLEQAGWWYPYFQFYSPSSYTFTALLYKWFSPHNPFIAYKLSLWCALLVGGIYIQRLALWFTESWAAAFLAGVVYLTAPYCLIVLSRLGGFNEGLALGLLPVAIFYTLKRFYADEENLAMVQMAFFWYLLLTTHTVTFIYTSILVGLLMLVLSFKTPNGMHRLVRVGIGYSLACLMGAWFLGPIIAFQKHFYIASTFSDVITFYNNFSPNFLSLVSPMANFIVKYDNVVGTIRPSIGLPICMGFAIAVYGFSQLKYQLKAPVNAWLLPLLIIFFIALVLAWSPINFWPWLPEQLRVGQYSWRILSQVTWLGSLLFAWAICWLFKNELDTRHVVIGVFLIIMGSSSWLAMIDKPLFPVATVVKNPHQIFAGSSYVLNTQLYPEYINTVDHLTLDTLIIGNKLKFDFPFYVSPKLLTFAEHPILLMKGQAANEVGQGNNKIIAFINDKIIGERQLKPGKFEWKIELKEFTDQKITKMLAIKFEKKGPFFTKPKANITVDMLSLTGFISNDQVLRVNQVETLCKQRKTHKICTINVSPNIKLIELPLLYYPNLFTLTLNGHKIVPQGILYGMQTVAGVIPEAGKKNIIKARFTGLVWANWVSLASWALWLLAAMMLVFKRRSPPLVG